MRRFYKQVSVVSAGAAFAIALDGRTLKTPARCELILPTRALADAIAAEWNGAGETIVPRALPMTGLANAAVDRVMPDPDAFAAALAGYGESDLLCYRAEGPERLTARQAAAWDPLLAWARRRYDVDFETVCGVMHRSQAAATLARLRQAVAARDAFALAGLAPLVTIGGSLIAALALAEAAVSLETAWAAVTVDEAWQAEQWGEDAEAAAALASRRADFTAGYRFLGLLR